MRTARSQSGAVLMVSLVMLTILTLLALASVQSNTLQLRMAGNTLAALTALQAAETALRAGESRLAARGSDSLPLPTDDGSSGIWTPDGLAAPGRQAPWWKERGTEWWQRHGILAHTAETTAARFVIEYRDRRRDALNLGQASDFAARRYYRITATASADQGRARTVLRSTYALRE
jgi:type IV pilus assembly protein PilX